MEEKKLQELLKAYMMSTILFITGILLKSIVLMYLWNVFATPFNVRLDLMQSTGLIIIATMLGVMPQEKYGDESAREENNRKMWKRFFNDVESSLIYLVLGYIISLF